MNIVLAILSILTIQKHVICMTLIGTRSNDDSESSVPTECLTPKDGEKGFCVPAKQCFSLVLAKNLSTPINEWRCGPKNENEKNPKVCCTQHHLILSASLSTTVLPPPSETISASSCGYQNISLHNRILGGEITSPGEFPWLARLMRRTDEGQLIFSCSGALIGPKVVLTSAHCLVSPNIMKIGSLYSVGLGEFDTACAKCSSKKNVMISNYVPHPDYDSSSTNHDNDIGVIFLIEEVKFNADISPICILEQSREGEEFFLGGWGKTETQKVSSVKLKISLASYSWDQCVKKYRGINVKITERQICVGGVKNRDSCQGDSGGPLMVRRNSTRWFVAGLTSFGVGCGQDGWPGVYAHVPSYVPWITNVINA